MVLAFAGDSTTTSAFAISLLVTRTRNRCSLLVCFALLVASNFFFTLTRSVNPNELSAANACDRTGEFQLEQPRQQTRRTQARPVGDRVQIARFTRRQARQHRIGGGGRAPPP